jgi:hypothetical protein
MSHVEQHPLYYHNAISLPLDMPPSKVHDMTEELHLKTESISRRDEWYVKLVL